MEKAQEPEQGTNQYIDSWHYEMLLSAERNQFYEDLIRENCKGKVVLEIGTGGGLLAVLAIRHGAEKVICCEENPAIAKAAQGLFTRLKLEDRIQLLMKNSRDIQTDEIPKADVILHELFGSDPFAEEMVPTLKDAQRFLKPGGILLPEKIQLVYKPLSNFNLPTKIVYKGIELLEMDYLISEIHPFLRVRDQAGPFGKGVLLPEVFISDLFEKPYSYIEKNKNLVGVDAIEVSYFIIHQGHRLQAAQFDAYQGRQHWETMIFSKVDVGSDQIIFSTKDHVRLLMQS